MTSTTPAPEFSDETIRRISDDLSLTYTWVRFLGAIGMLVAIITVVVAGVTFLAGVTDLNRGGIGYVIAGLTFAVVAVIWTYPSRKLLSYARRIQKFRTTQSQADLLQVINEQKAFWRFATIAVVALAVATVIASFVRAPA